MSSRYPHLGGSGYLPYSFPFSSEGDPWHKKIIKWGTRAQKAWTDKRAIHSWRVLDPCVWKALALRKSWSGDWVITGVKALWWELSRWWQWMIVRFHKLVYVMALGKTPTFHLLCTHTRQMYESRDGHTAMLPHLWRRWRPLSTVGPYCCPVILLHLPVVLSPPYINQIPRWLELTTVRKWPFDWVLHNTFPHSAKFWNKE